MVMGFGVPPGFRVWGPEFRVVYMLDLTRVLGYTPSPHGNPSLSSHSPDEP